eukprot:Lankesteria_metandrocarpae@DN10403_c0_g1_i1.p1
MVDRGAPVDDPPLLGNTLQDSTMLAQMDALKSQLIQAQANETRLLSQLDKARASATSPKAAPWSSSASWSSSDVGDDDSPSIAVPKSDGHERSLSVQLNKVEEEKRLILERLQSMEAKKVTLQHRVLSLEHAVDDQQRISNEHNVDGAAAMRSDAVAPSDADAAKVAELHEEVSMLQSELIQMKDQLCKTRDDSDRKCMQLSDDNGRLEIELKEAKSVAVDAEDSLGSMVTEKQVLARRVDILESDAGTARAVDNSEAIAQLE